MFEMFEVLMNQHDSHFGENTSEKRDRLPAVPLLPVLLNLSGSTAYSQEMASSEVSRRDRPLGGLLQ